MIRSDGSPAVVIRELNVVRGKRRVLPDLSLEVPSGEVVGLLLRT